MNYNDDFYVTLASNACLKYYPDNKTSYFKTLLNRPLYLENYQVALSEIIFPTRICNIFDNNNTIFFGPFFSAHIPVQNRKTTSYLRQFISCKIPKGIYENIETLIDVINASVIKRSGWDENMLELSDGKVCITQDFKTKLDDQVAHGAEIKVQSKAAVQFENRLGTILGYPPNANIIKTSPSYYSLVAGIPGEIFLYTNIIDYQIISNTSAQLLKIIPISLNDDVKNRIEFLNRNYLNVIVNQIDNITIECRDAQSQLIPFEDGTNIILTLHFKKNNIKPVNTRFVSSFKV